MRLWVEFSLWNQEVERENQILKCEKAVAGRELLRQLIRDSIQKKFEETIISKTNCFNDLKILQHIIRISRDY
jgi:hypothetical protein